MMLELKQFYSDCIPQPTDIVKAMETADREHCFVKLTWKNYDSGGRLQDTYIKPHDDFDKICYNIRISTNRNKYLG